MQAALYALITDPTSTVHLIMPINVTELVTAIFYGIATLCIPVATVYLMFVDKRSKRVEATSVATAATVTAVKEDLSKVKTNVELIERNTNSLTTQLKTAARQNGVVEGERIGAERGEESARKLAQGRAEGIADERASVAAAGKVATGSPMTSTGEDPIPVEDEAAAKISRDIAKSTADSAAAANAINERVAEATEKSADAQQQIADTTKNK